LAVSARSVGAWKVAEAAAAFENAATSLEPVILGPVMRQLSARVWEAHIAIDRLLISPVILASLPADGDREEVAIRTD